MAQVNVEVRQHPCQARDLDGNPLFDDDGRPISAIPRDVQQSIYLNGKLIGYCGGKASDPISIIKSPAEIPSTVREIIIEKVANILGGDWHDAKRVSQAPVIGAASGQVDD